MKAIVTVVGKDQVGIIAFVTAKLAEYNINILDIRQTVMHGYFSMIMITDISEAKLPLADLTSEMAEAGGHMSLSIRIQRADIFDAMHKI